ncbi:hypothetical protein GCM10009716_10520 [Streptomyces sodiiphilus]|uniref:DUF748 domain-containing protein n=1 Tax=Streptomyces sodiiphilus TaxID=226217 RepID=A0ABP5A631_9ACTN
MNTLTKLGAFAAGVALTFAGAYAAGHTVGPEPSDPAPAHHSGGSGHESHDEQATGTPALAGGLQVSDRGYTLHPPAEPLEAGEETDFRFTVTGPDGEPLTEYTPSHEEDLHLIVVGRDLSGYQHLHPERDAEGTWSVPITFGNAGDYRVFADFAPLDPSVGGLTLGADVAVSGPYEPAALPDPGNTAEVDGYTVTLEGAPTTGSAGEVTLSVSRDGEPVTDLEPYLGAYGHLVALRQGDLAYLHVHPNGEPGDGRTEAGPEISFSTQAPSPGTYRLYLDFRHDGEVRTAEFTVTVTGDASGRAPAAGGHDDGHDH